MCLRGEINITQLIQSLHFGQQAQKDQVKIPERYGGYYSLQLLLIPTEKVQNLTPLFQHQTRSFQVKEIKIIKNYQEDPMKSHLKLLHNKLHWNQKQTKINIR